MAFDWVSMSGLPIGWVKGMHPTALRFKMLERSLFGRHVIIGGGQMHDDPRWFKYYWKIWTAADCPEDDGEVFDECWYPTSLPPVPELAFKAAIDRMHELCRDSIPFMLANERVKRLGTDTGWTLELVEKYGGGRVAPAFDEDVDEALFGHK
jgi:hypothetical protein